MTNDAATNDQREERDTKTPKDISTYWQVQLGLADKDQQDWEKDGRAVVARYKAEQKQATKRDGKWFNILYSNTETLKSTLYGRTAKPDVRRRFADKDPNARQAAEIIERALIYSAESYDVDKCIEPALHDYLLPGRGVVRVEYEPVIKSVPDPATGKPIDAIADQVVRERYVYWEDYRQSPARIQEDVTWRAFRHIMSREDLRENKFDNAEAVPLNWVPDTGSKQPVPDDLKRAEVWEIWDKNKRERVWIVKGHDAPLRVDPDPYGLESFFPLPDPLASVADTETLVPTPEFHTYRDQADDLDEITARISRLTRALKRRGVYDQAVKELKRLATAGDNQFIPVENWQALSTKGGLAAAFQTEDISLIAVVLKELYAQRAMLVQGIYELTGIADIMRGASDPDETLGAQQLKAQFGSTRIKRRQRAVQKWIRDLYKLKAEIIAEHFEPQVLQEMTGIQVTPEVMQILRSDKLRSYRIDIETDSTVFEDSETIKQQTSEALTAIGGFFDKALPTIQAAPELAPLAFEMVGMAARNLKKGRELEDTIEQTKEAILQKAQQPPPPDPKVQAEQAKAQAAQDKAQMDMQVAQQKAAIEMQKMQAELQMQREELNLMREKLGMEMQAQQQQMAIDQQKAQQDLMMQERTNQMDMERSEREHELGMEATQVKHDTGLEMMAEKAKQQKAQAKKPAARK